MQNALQSIGTSNSYGNTGNFRRYTPYEPNWTYYKAPIGDDVLSELTANNGGIKGMFDNLVNNYKARYQARRAPGGIFSGAGTGTSAGTGGSLTSAVKSNLGWNAKSGLQLMGKNVGKAVPYLAGGLSAVQAIQGADELSNARDDTEDLVNQILLSSSGNPNTNLDLTAEQKKLLRKLKNDGSSSDASLSDIDLLDVLKGMGTGALGGSLGGVPGAIVGAVGGGINAGIDSMTSEQVANQAELEALLEALQMSEMNYKNNLRQRMYAGY